MNVSQEIWNTYIKALSQINKRAAADMLRWIEKNGIADRRALVEHAYGLATVYGEGSAALAAEMYDAIAVVEGVALPPAEVAATATWQETSDGIYGVLAKSSNSNMLSSVVYRLVKLAGVDTTAKNAIRDKAQWAWIPSGETCAFCIMLASNGWQTASKNILKGGHATHVHANCDCTFAIRHDSTTNYRGYDPQKYRDMYYDAPLDGEAPNATNRINAMRREFYAENRDRINAQKRNAYAKRVALNSSAAEETKV